MKLYICGNGFDRHHNLPTGYSDYKNYLSEHHPTLLRDYNSFPYLTETAISDRWTDVEAALCIDYDEFFYESVHCS